MPLLLSRMSQFADDAKSSKAGAIADSAQAFDNDNVVHGVATYNYSVAYSGIHMDLTADGQTINTAPFSGQPMCT